MESLEAALRRGILAVTPEAPPYDVATLESRLDKQTWKSRFQVRVVGLAAVLMLAPATIVDRAYSMFDLKDPTNRDRIAMGRRQCLPARRGVLRRQGHVRAAVANCAGSGSPTRTSAGWARTALAASSVASA